MGSVTTAMSISLDGIVGGLGEQGWPVHERLHGWKFDLASFRERLGMGDGGQRNSDSEILAEEFDRTGAYVMGRGMFDSGVEHWGDDPPFHVPVFVLTHTAQETLPRQGGTSFTFVTGGIEDAVAQAKAAAGDKNIFISGGASTVQQCIAAGLLDELELHIAPVLLGDGVRLFEHIGTRPIELQSVRVAAESAGVTHLKLRIVK